MVSIIMLVPNHTSTFLEPNMIRGARGVVDNFDMLNDVGCYGCPDLWIYSIMKQLKINQKQNLRKVRDCFYYAPYKLSETRIWIA